MTSGPQPGATSAQPSDHFQAVPPRTTGKLRVLRVGEVELRLDSHTLRVNSETLYLPPREFDVLLLLMDNAGRVISRRELLDTCWGPGHSDANKTVEVHIRRLRNKLRIPGQPNPIRTVYGIGYIVDLPD